jgi:hypothetical protein
LLLALACFCALMLIGLAFLSLCGRGSLTIGDTLLAPAFGISLVVIPTLLLNQLGLPVRRFAFLECLFFLILSLAVLLVRRGLPKKSVLAFLPIIFVALFLVGRPAIQYGFDWVSYSNDDMINYSLAADRLADHGYYEEPPPVRDELYRGFAPGYWFEYALDGERTGVEMMLAIVVSLTGMRGFQVFMPFILAGHLCLVTACAGLGWSIRKGLDEACIVALLAAVSPLIALGTLYQLLGQVFGLTIMTAAMALPSILLEKPERRSVQVVAAASILGAGLMLIYPEMLPFIIVVYLIVGGASLARGHIKWRPIALSTAATCLIVALLTGENFYKMIGLLASRVLSQAPRAGAISFTFPYYLVPSGLADLWGLNVISSYRGEPFLSLTIALAILLTAFVIISTASTVQKNLYPGVVIFAVMFLIGVVMFFKHVDFGLFKLAMYMQPFMLATLVVALVSIKRFPRVTAGVLILLIGLNVYSQSRYVETSADGGRALTAGFVEVRGASPRHLLRTLRDLEEIGKNADAIFSDAGNLSLAKYETGYVGNKPIFFVTREFRSNLFGVPRLPFSSLRPEYPSLSRRAAKLITGAQSLRESGVFSFGSHAVARFYLPSLGMRYKNVQWYLTGEVDSILNRSQSVSSNRLVFISRSRQVRNRLALVESSLGFVPGPGAPMDRISLFQVEPDYFRLGDTMSGLGRYMVMSVIHPSAQIRVVASLSDTLSADGVNRLPPAMIVGRERVRLPLIGRGSARVISPIVAPIDWNGSHLLGVDMGVEGHHFRVPRNGLMGLYGRNVVLDPRALTAFGRDLSIVSEGEYERIRPPAYLSDLTSSLRNPNLFYSGIYEDGWVSEHSQMTLAVRNQTMYVMRGLIPLIDDPTYNTRLTCRIDGIPVLRRRLGVGYFNLEIPISLREGRHTVDLKFSSFQRLKGSDGRPASARFFSIGFSG